MMTGSAVVNTVLGRIPAEDLGVTLSHEHLAVNPGDPARYGDSVIKDVGRSIQDAAEFASSGGRTIVEMTPLNFGRDVLAYRDISKAAGVHVVCATGFHKEEFIPPWFTNKSNSEIIELLKTEITHGIADTGIKPGVIKIGTSHNAITEVEKRAIEIASIVQRETSLTINTHCDRGTMALEQCHLFLKFGADPHKVILGHADIPNDGEYLKRLCSLGFNVLSGDMGKKTYLTSYGGEPGLGYVPGEFKRRLLENGISEVEIDRILVENPRRVFGVNPRQTLN